MEIENIPVSANPVKKKRAKRTKKQQPNPAESLIKALNFILPAQKRIGTIEDQYCFINNHWLVASNGKIMLATKIFEDLNACPHTYQFLNSLNNCENKLSIVQLSTHELEINSEPFKGIVSCVDPSQLQLLNPDIMRHIVQQPELYLCFNILNPIISETAEYTFYSHILLQDNTCVATNGNILLEVWHGEAVDGRFTINKQAATAINKSDKRLIGIGSSANTFTFFFDDESMLTSVLSNDSYPEYLNLFKTEINAGPPPVNFFKAVKAIADFCTDGMVYMFKDSITNLANVGKESSYKVKGLPSAMMSFSIKSLLLIESYADSIEFDAEANKLYFFGDSLRGVIIGGNRPEENKIESDNVPF